MFCFGIERSGWETWVVGSEKGFVPGLEEGFGGCQGWLLVFEVVDLEGGSANGSCSTLEEKSRPRDPILGKGWPREARRRSACSCNSRSSMPRSCEKSGGRLMLACLSVILRAEAKGSIDCRFRCRSRQLKFTLSVKRSHQSLKRSRTVRCPV